MKGQVNYEIVAILIIRLFEYTRNTVTTLRMSKTSLVSGFVSTVLLPITKIQSYENLFS